jgi:hypothetical protein
VTLKKTAEALVILKPLLNVIFLACMFYIGYLFFYSSISMQNRYGVPSLLLAVWSLLLSSLIGLYSHKPSTDNVDKGWFARMKSKVGRGLFNMVTLIFALVTFALLYVTFRLLRL